MNKILNKNIEVIDLGLIDYKEAWDYQEALFRKTVDQKIRNRRTPEHETPTPNYLIFCEHPHVYTLGKSGKPENLLLNGDELKQRAIQYYKINRGGDITYHGPGQIVCYPILDLENFFTDIHQYLRFLEEAVIQTLSHFGVEAGRIEGLTGVWVGEEKICAMGVRSSRWVTMHGLAFNVNVDLGYFKNIIPCGIDDKEVTSLKKVLDRELEINEVKEDLKRRIVQQFEMEETTNEK